MPQQQVQHRTAAGLYQQFNPINQTPEGAQLEAENTVIDREGIISLRRGFDRSGTVYTNVPAAFGEYKDSLFALDGSTIKYDTGALSWAGTFAAPDANNRMRFIEDRKNLYLTTSKGLFKTDAKATPAVQSGVPQGLDMQDALTSIGDGWFTSGNQTSYHVLFGREDASMYLLLSAASQPLALTNATFSVVCDWSGGVATIVQKAHGYTTGDTITIAGTADLYDGSQTITVFDVDTYIFTLASEPTDTTDVSGTAGKAHDVDLTATIPDDILEGDFYEVYRTKLSGSASTLPGDRHFKVQRVTILAADITAGTVTFSDIFDDGFLGDDLYQNAERETVSQANDRPPYATDMTVWKGYAWFANTSREHQIEIQLLSLTGLSGDTLTVAGRVYTAAATEVIGSQQYAVSTAESTTAGNIRETARSLIRVLNRDTGNTLTYAHYISGTDDPPGKILIRHRLLNQAAFTVLASDDTLWTPDLNPAASSDDNQKINNLHRGKFEQPEAVPRLAGAKPLGSEKFAIVRILPLRDSLVVLKEEGIWRVSGESETSFTFKLLDPSTRILCPESAVVLDNAAYVVTNQGVVRVTETGTAIISRPIESAFKKLFSFANFKTLTHAVAYESDKKYILFAQGAVSDTFPTVAWVYDFITKAWTQWVKDVQVAHVMFVEDKLYLGHAVDKFALRERKSFGTALDDFRDETLAVTVDSIGTTTSAAGKTVSTVTLNYTYTGKALEIGFLFEQGIVEGGVEKVTDNGSNDFTLELSEELDGLVTGAATLSLPITARIRWAPEDMGAVGTMKQIPEVQIYTETNTAEHVAIGFASDIINGEEIQSINRSPTAGWGVTEWGEGGWGDDDPDASTPIRVITPRDYQRCRALSLIFKHSFAKETFGIVNVAYVYRVISARTVRTPA